MRYKIKWGRGGEKDEWSILNVLSNMCVSPLVAVYHKLFAWLYLILSVARGLTGWLLAYCVFYQCQQFWFIWFHSKFNPWAQHHEWWLHSASMINRWHFHFKCYRISVSVCYVHCRSYIVPIAKTCSRRNIYATFEIFYRRKHCMHACIQRTLVLLFLCLCWHFQLR